MRQHPGSPDAPVCGPHQIYGNPTLDVPARPQVGLLTLFGQTTGHPFQGFRQFHTQKSVHRGNKGGEVPELLETCLQVHLLLPPLCLLKALLLCFLLMVIGVSVHEMHVLNTVGPVLTEVTDQEVSLLFRVI